MTHPFQPDPDVKDYCKCGFHKSNPEHDHFPVIRRYEHERCEDLIEEWKSRALVAERERDSLRDEVDGLRRDLAKAEGTIREEAEL